MGRTREREIEREWLACNVGERARNDLAAGKQQSTPSSKETGRKKLRTGAEGHSRGISVRQQKTDTDGPEKSGDQRRVQWLQREQRNATGLQQMQPRSAEGTGTEHARTREKRENFQKGRRKSTT